MSPDENHEFEQKVWSKKVRQIQGHAKVQGQRSRSNATEKYSDYEY